MIKKTAKIAGGIAVGAVIGGCILPRILFRDLYSDTWPPLWKEAMLYLITGFIAAFSVLILICRIKDAVYKRKHPYHWDGKPGIVEGKALFESKLPQEINWDEINGFLRTTGFHRALLLKNWRQSDAITQYPISETSLECLGCLHADLASCYSGMFVCNENGKEDRHGEYQFLREYLYSKYGRIDADNLEKIYLYYLQDDR